MMRQAILFTTALAAGCIVASAASAQVTARWLSQSQQTSTQYPIETAAMERIQAGGGPKVERSEFQTLGINMADALRLVRSGSFDIVSTQIGLASRDDPFLEGIDLIGVSTSQEDLKAAVDAYREVFDKRVRERFGARVLAIWPFGAQVFFCNQPIKSLDDLKGLRVRSFTPSMSKLLEALGATPVSLAFPEVYPSLQRGVTNCGITSATSANTGRWPEVTTHLLPLSVSGAVQAHLVNEAWWSKLSPQQQDVVTREMRKMEADLWSLARSTNEDATNCSTGREPCGNHARFKMTLAQVSPEDIARVGRLSADVVVGEWAARCERVYSGCKEVWGETIGRARKLSIK